MKKITAILLACAFIFAGCEKKEEKEIYPVEAMGITFNSRPEKVLCLNEDNEERLISMGYGRFLIREKNFESETFPTKDEVLSLSPDLVIGNEETGDSIVNALNEKGINYIEIPLLKSEEEIQNTASSFALIFEGSEKGELRRQQIEYYSDGYEANILENANEIISLYYEEAPSTLFAGALNYAYTPDTFEGQFLKDCGFKNAAENYTNYYVPFNELTEKIDILIYPSHLEEEFSSIEAERRYGYDASLIKNQDMSLYTFREDILKGLFPDEEFTPKDIIMPVEIPEEEPLKWYERLFS